jgi:hypothetical protein
MTHEPMNKGILGSFMCNRGYFGNSYVYVRRICYKGNHFATFAMWFIGARIDYFIWLHGYYGLQNIIIVVSFICHYYFKRENSHVCIDVNSLFKRMQNFIKYLNNLI